MRFCETVIFLLIDKWKIVPQVNAVFSITVFGKNTELKKRKLMKKRNRLIVCFAVLSIFSTSPAYTSVVGTDPSQEEKVCRDNEVNEEGQEGIPLILSDKSEVVVSLVTLSESESDLVNEMIPGGLLGIISEEFPDHEEPLGYGTLLGSVAPEGFFGLYNSNGLFQLLQNNMLFNASAVEPGLCPIIKNKYVGFELTTELNSFYGWIQVETDGITDSALDYVEENNENASGQTDVSAIPLPPSFLLLLPGVAAVLARKKKLAGSR